MKNMMGLPVILIPAFQPSRVLIQLVDDLLARNFNRIIVIDDGSSPKGSGIFEDLKKKQFVTVIHHEINMGKGAALKTGLRFILDNFGDTACVMTVDADGQHLAEDILAVAEKNRLEALVLGTRELDKKIPFRSRVGNAITRRIFSFYTGLNLKDTQTGLRRIPKIMFRQLLNLNEERYDFEMEMLYQVIVNWHFPIIEVPISTVYEPGNPTSHFNPIIDSIRVLKVLFSHFPQRLKFKKKRAGSGYT